MAEIRSTMDIVLERAARMGRADAEEMRAEGLRKQGVQEAAGFLDDAAKKPAVLADALEAAPEAGRRAMLEGMAETLIRNLFLPRDEAGRNRTRRAAAGLKALPGGGRNVSALCAEAEQLTGRYGEHRAEIEGQLKDQLRMQLQQALAVEAQRAGLAADSESLRKAAARIDPTMDPRYAQEWARIEAELNDQYGRALDQCRAELGHLFGVNI